MIIIISNNLEILLQENLKRPPISWLGNWVLSFENNFFFQVHVTLTKNIQTYRYRWHGILRVIFVIELVNKWVIK